MHGPIVGRRQPGAGRSLVRAWTAKRNQAALGLAAPQSARFKARPARGFWAALEPAKQTGLERRGNL